VTSTRKFAVISGSERQPVSGARLIHNSHPDQDIEVSIRIRSKAEAQRPEFKSALSKPGFKQMSRADYEGTHGADPADVEKIRKFAQEFGLKVRETGTELARRTVMVSGKVSDLEKAFDVELKEYSCSTGNFRGRVGTLSVPTEYADIITGVFGLDNRRQAEPHFRRWGQPDQHKHKTPASTTSHNPNDVAQLYDYPTGDGTGQCIGLIELGGGFKLDDLSTYFGTLNIKTPQVISVSVDGGTNSPSTPDSADGEVMLDIEVAGAIAPAAKIVVYFAPNTDQGFLDAITTAVHDSKNQPSVISISWGSAESNWTSQALTNFDEAFQSAAAMGVTVCVASGDSGSSDGVSDGKNHVDFPASSSFALGCGGTTLQSSSRKIGSESVWNDQPSGGATGGGVSNVFPLPAWQTGFGVPAPTVKAGGRGVPDVSGDADPNSGYNIRVDGENAVFGGTSAVAPLWAALIARINQQAGKSIGFLNPLIYAQTVEAAGFRDVTQGNNGSFKAVKGWDACTGLGTPDGTQLLALLTAKPASPTATSDRARKSKQSSVA
jgi:kumamolisin